MPRWASGCRSALSPRYSGRIVRAGRWLLLIVQALKTTLAIPAALDLLVQALRRQGYLRAKSVIDQYDVLEERSTEQRLV